VSEHGLPLESGCMRTLRPSLSFRTLWWRPATMARGIKKHLKRLNAPKHWMLDKLGGVFVRF
jgi:RS4NT (NUC023) domain